VQIDPAKLVEARLARAMSQEEAAMACDLSARTIQRIEAGHPASLESTKALVSTFGRVVLYELAADGVGRALPWKLAPAGIERASRLFASLGFDGLRVLFAAVCLVIAVAKPLVPGRTGLFVHGDVYALGLLRSVPAGAHEVLGYWIAPLMIVSAGSLLASIGRLRNLIRTGCAEIR
jgi:DNA-binding XRE family transcriptional regulator